MTKTAVFGLDDPYGDTNDEIYLKQQGFERATPEEWYGDFVGSDSDKEWTPETHTRTGEPLAWKKQVGDSMWWLSPGAWGNPRGWTTSESDLNGTTDVIHDDSRTHGSLQDAVKHINRGNQGGFKGARMSFLEHDPMPSGPNAQLEWIGRMHPNLPLAASLPKMGYGEVFAPPIVDTLREEGVCPQCGDSSFNGAKCPVCQFVMPPEHFQDPDTSKAQEFRDQQDMREGDMPDQDDMTGGDNNFFGNEDDDQNDSDYDGLPDDVDTDDDNDGVSDDSDDDDDEDGQSDEDEDEDNDEEQQKESARNQALARRRLAEAQRRLALSRQRRSQTYDGLGSGEEAIADTPSPQSGVAVEEPASTDVTNLDQNQSLDPVDKRDDVTDLPEGDLRFSSKRPAQRRPRQVPVQQGRQMRRRADIDQTPSEAAEPESREDVEVPVVDTDDRAQSTQYDAGEFEDNQGKDVQNPVLDNDQTWVPGERTSARRKTAGPILKRASATQAYQLADLYSELGLIPQEARYKAIARIERMSALEANAQIVLAERMKQVLASRPTVLPGTRVPRGDGSYPSSFPKVAARNPRMGQAPRKTAALNEAADVLLTF